MSDSYTIQALAAGGSTPSEIAQAMELPIELVKSSLGRTSEITEEEAIRLKDVLLGVAEGAYANATVGDQVKAAIHLHQTAVDQQRISKGGNLQSMIFQLLMEKASKKKELIVAAE